MLDEDRDTNPPSPGGCTSQCASHVGRMRNSPCSKTIFKPIVVALVASGIVISIGFFLSLATMLDRAEIEQKKQLANVFVERELAALEAVAADYAWWDEAFVNLAVSFDADWEKDNISGYLPEAFGFNLAALKYPKKKINWLTKRRNSSGKPAIGLSQLIDKMPNRLSKDGTPPIATGYIRVDGAIYFASVATLSPYTNDALKSQYPLEKRPILILGKEVPPAVLSAVARDFLLPNLTWSLVQPKHLEQALAIQNTPGHPLGWLTWTMERKGSKLVSAVFPIFILFGFITLAAIYFHNRTRDQLERELREEKNFLDSIIDNIPNMLFVKEAHKLSFVRFNRAGEELLGIKEEELLGKTDRDFFPKEQADFFIAKDRNVIDYDGFLDIPEEQIDSSTGKTILLHTQKIGVYDEDGKPRYLVGISEDITERKEIENRLKELASKDQLTSLATRATCTHDIDKAIAHSRRTQKQMAVLFIDLDGFKPINDEFGHARGDEVLIEIAKRLSATVRDMDCVGRIGGDEFLIALNELEPESDIEVIARKILDKVNQPIALNDSSSTSVKVSCSIGIAVYPTHGNTTEELIHEADSAMYQVKRTGKSDIAFCGE